MTDEQRDATPWQDLRAQMVEEQVRRRGIRDPRVLDAMMTVPREEFLPRRIRSEAYQDRALPVEHGQTVSQPFIVAYMTEKLATTPDDRVLEIGTGMGYQTAILARLSKHVYTVERIADLSRQAAANLSRYPNVTFVVGDGSVGWPEHAPYDRIIVTAAAPGVPPALVDQLTDGGILIIPTGSAAEQTIVRVIRKGSRSRETPLLACRFVKLIGKAAWRADE